MKRFASSFFGAQADLSLAVFAAFWLLAVSAAESMVSPEAHSVAVAVVAPLVVETL